MKTTRYTLLAAALLLAASCANDPVEDIINPSAPGAALPGGTFVIDYTAGMEGADTRLEANQRIRSLDYLIYQSATENGDYTLLKKCSIPDINTNTTWPLTRDKMTWEQREALKDTLSTDKYYKMVFVANADDDIWDPAGTSGFHALQNVEEGSNFNEGRLVLPPNGQFEDDNMYYMATLAVDGNDYATDEDKTATLTITLQRMINKVEVKLADDVVNGIQEKGTITNYVTSKLDEQYNIYYYKDDQTGKLYDVVSQYMDTKANFTPEGGSNKKTSQQKFKDILGAENNKKKVVESITDCNNEYTETTQKCCVRHQFITEMKELFLKYCQWDNIKTIEFSYSSKSYPQAIDFNYVTKAEGSNETYTLIAHKNEETENSYIFYTFGNNTENDKELNLISSATFKKEDGSEAFPTIQKEVIPGKGIIKGNQHIILSFDPWQIIISSETFKFTKDEYDLQQVLQWNWENDFEYAWDTTITGWHKDDMISWVNTLFIGNGNNNTSFEPYTLELEIPKIEINNPWVKKEETGNNE